MKKRVDAKRFPGINTVCKKLADGTFKVMRYHRLAKRRIYSEPGTAAFEAEYMRIVRGWAPLPAQPKKIFVYFVKAETTGHIKIGKAGRPKSRLAELQIGSPDKLSIIGTIPDPSGGALEAELHARFGRHRLHGEWFSAAPAILEFIAESAVSRASVSL